MFENIALSFQGIWNHKTRSFLTVLGIIIGIAAIITIVSTIKGTNDQIKENLIGSGTNVVTVRITSSDGGYVDLEYEGTPQSVRIPDKKIRDGLKKLPGIVNASFYHMREYMGGVYYQNTAFEGRLLGIDELYFDVLDYQINYGRGFTDKDHEQRKKVAILDDRAAAAIFEGRNPVGKTLEIMQEPFTVIGVAAKNSAGSVVINNLRDYYMYADTNAGSIFIPMECWPTILHYDELPTIAVRAASTDEMTEAGNNAAEYLNGKLIKERGYEFRADNLLEQAEELQALANATNQQLVWIAGISLLVGGIGVMNIMLVSVTERTREIGLKKAIGAKKRRILWQFLTEAAVLTSIGGLLGVASGIGLSRLISGMTGTPAAISIPACVIAVAFSMAIGVTFGLIPAVKAARLDPIEALRRE